MVKIIGIVIIGTSVILGIASRFIFKKSDNIVEEIAEEVIKNKTGYTIDLSPDTPEKKPDISLDMIMTPKDKKEVDGEDKCDK